jgi:hypothetical protein
MSYEEFLKLFREKIRPGLVLDNPGGGTSTVLSVADSGKVRYQRKNSKIDVDIHVLYEAYCRFKGKQCRTTDLRAYVPHIFDSNARPAGHSCNCTFLFLVLKAMRLCGEIEGAGKAGNPFYVDIKG